MPALVAGIHVLDNEALTKAWMAGHRRAQATPSFGRLWRAEATPSFGRLCPAMASGECIVMNYWLVKSEPSSWSWDQQVARGAKGEAWTGVRNFTARQNLVNMKKGDKAFFYHSNEGKDIVGIAEIIKESYPDPTDKTGKFVCVDIKAEKPLPKPVTMAAIKAEKKLADMALVKYSRLSVQPVTAEEWKLVCKMGGL
jgi:predicted RNA-binding protein with PUA-like domain